MSEGVVLNPTRLVLAALIGLVILLVLIIKFNVQAMIAILIGAICIGLLAGMPTQDIISAVNDGIGNTLKGIALLVGLGSMFGAILEVSGGAQTIAVTMVKKFGDEKAAWALGDVYKRQLPDRQPHMRRSRCISFHQFLRWFFS